jgi:hypothetical protein
MGFPLSEKESSSDALSLELAGGNSSRAGTIKARALTAQSRSLAVPNAPTVDEAGLPEFYFSAWTALWAPARVSGEVYQKLNAAAANALAALCARGSQTSVRTYFLATNKHQTCSALFRKPR